MTGVEGVNAARNDRSGDIRARCAPARRNIPTMLDVTASKNLNATTDPPRRRSSKPIRSTSNAMVASRAMQVRGCGPLSTKESSPTILPGPHTANVDVPTGVEKFIESAPRTTRRQLRGASPSAKTSWPREKSYRFNGSRNSLSSAGRKVPKNGIDRRTSSSTVEGDDGTGHRVASLVGVAAASARRSGRGSFWCELPPRA
jgi:hypothetical protein